MENRSHAMLAGLFTLVFLIAAAIAAIWISKKNVPLKPYELVASSPVTGLSVQSQVRYQGVPVGKVESLRFIEDKPGQVRILIGVDPKAPVTEATWAEIVTAGVTGISNVELRDNGTSKVRLESSAQHLAEIPIKPSFLERLQSQGGGMLVSLERVFKTMCHGGPQPDPSSRCERRLVQRRHSGDRVLLPEVVWCAPPGVAPSSFPSGSRV